MSSTADFQLDTRRLRQRFNATAGSAADAGFLAREVSARMAERLDYIRHTPARILDVGCGTGADLAMLAQRYPQAERFGLDFAGAQLTQARGNPGLLQRVLSSVRGTAARLICADAQAIPLAHRSVQMVWSNLMLNWLADPLPALREMHRVLDLGGLLMFATLGPDTLKELAACLPGLPGQRVHRFIDMHDLGDALLGAGFADPVMDMQTLTLTYQHLDDLMRDIRQGGCNNASSLRPRGLSGKAAWRQARHQYEALRQDGRLPATVEIVFGHAWKAAAKTAEDGRSIINFHKRNAE